MSVGTILALGALIGMPAILAVGGIALGIVETILFNIFARGFGGIRAEPFEHRE